jgi:hypothetical protein
VQGFLDQGKATTDATRNDFRAAADTAATTWDGKIKATADQLKLDNETADTLYKTTDDAVKSTDPAVKVAALVAQGMTPEDAQYLVDKGYTGNGLIKDNENRTLGDTVNATDKAGYTRLMELLGKTSGYDFTASGNTDKAYTTDQKQIQASADLNKLLKDLEVGVTGATGGAEATRTSINKAINQVSAGSNHPAWAQTANTLIQAGVPPEVVTRMGELGNQGKLTTEMVTKYIKANQNTQTFGNVASSDQVTQYNNLLSLLGISRDERFDATPQSAMSASNDYNYFMNPDNFMEPVPYSIPSNPKNVDTDGDGAPDSYDWDVNKDGLGNVTDAIKGGGFIMTEDQRDIAAREEQARAEAAAAEAARIAAAKAEAAAKTKGSGGSSGNTRRLD